MLSSESLTTRCRIVRSESYKAQRERNARFEHLRRLICKDVEPTEAPTEWLPECAWTIHAHQTGPVYVTSWSQEPDGTWVGPDSPDARYVREQGEAVMKEEHRGAHQHLLVDAFREELLDRREAYRAERIYDPRPTGQITTNLRSGWVSYSSSQAKARVTLNRTTLTVTLRYGALVIEKRKYADLNAATAAARRITAWCKDWLEAHDHEPNVAHASTEHSSEPLERTRVLRDRLSRQDIPANVRFIR